MNNIGRSSLQRAESQRHGHQPNVPHWQTHVTQRTPEKNRCMKQLNRNSREPEDYE